VNRIPRGIDPRNFVGEKFKEIQNTRDNDDDRIAEDFERLIRRRKRDPMEVNCQSGRKDGEVKINTGETGQAKRDAEKVQPLHDEIMGARG
jgi:hypothetical protein